MLDFAASMLAELERWMLTAGPAMIDLSTFCDTSDKLMSSASVVEEVQKRLYTDEARPPFSNTALRHSTSKLPLSRWQLYARACPTGDDAQAALWAAAEGHGRHVTAGGVAW